MLRTRSLPPPTTPGRDGNIVLGSGSTRVLRHQFDEIDGATWSSFWRHAYPPVQKSFGKPARQFIEATSG